MSRLKIFCSLLWCVAATTLFSENTATVLRVHPWLTRGLAKESLIGLKFEGDGGGSLRAVTFKLTCEGCTADDFSNFSLELMRDSSTGSNGAFGYYAQNAIALTGGEEDTMRLTTEVSADKSVITLTFTEETAAADYSADNWIFPKTPSRAESDRVWVTATVNAEMAVGAKVLCEVVDETVSLSGRSYAVADAETPRAHRIYPYRYRVTAYMQGGAVIWRLAAGNEATERLRNLTDVVQIKAIPVYDSETDTFGVAWASNIPIHSPRFSVISRRNVIAFRP